MYKKYYDIGENIISIENNLIKNFYNNLEKFRVRNYENTRECVASYKIEITDKIPYLVENDINIVYSDLFYAVYFDKGEEHRVFFYEGQPYSELCLKDDGNNILYVNYDNKEMLTNELLMLNNLAIENTYINQDSFILHSSFIKYNNKAILFTAPSGTGKSTQANLWKEYMKAEIINGDRTLLKRSNNKWSGFGLPFCGTSQYCKNDNAELDAIVILRQSLENKIIKCNKGIAIKKLLSETTVNYWNKDFVEKVMDLLTDLVEDVDVYMLSCRKDKGAVDILYEMLESEK